MSLNTDSFITIVVPVYNEEAVLPIFHERLDRVRQSLDIESRVLYVDDGSVDRTWHFIQSRRHADPGVGGIRLSRNFGKEHALTAGLDAAEGDAVIVIDADLQDPPEVIPTLIEEWRSGHDVVYGTRTNRRGDAALKKLTARGFYSVMAHVGEMPLPPNAGDFRLLSRRAMDGLLRLRESNRFMKGLFSWVGYRQKSVDYERQPRAAGETKWNYWRLWNFALDGITSFSTAPLRIATYLGLLTAIAAFVYGVTIIGKTLLFGEPVPGYPSLMVVVLFLGGIQLIALGIIGEYLGRLYEESKRRPLYLIDEIAQPGRSDKRS